MLLNLQIVFIGTIFSFGKNDIGKVSKPIKGKNGMYMFQLEQIIEAPKTNDYTANKQTVSADLKRRAIGTYNDGDIYKALKKKANVVARCRRSSAAGGYRVTPSAML